MKKGSRLKNILPICRCSCSCAGRSSTIIQTSKHEHIRRKHWGGEPLPVVHKSETNLNVCKLEPPSSTFTTPSSLPSSSVSFMQFAKDKRTRRRVVSWPGAMTGTCKMKQQWKPTSVTQMDLWEQSTQTQLSRKVRSFKGSHATAPSCIAKSLDGGSDAYCLLVQGT